MSELSDQEIAQDLRACNMPVNKALIAAGKACVIGYMKRQVNTPEQEQAGEIFTGNED